MGWQDIAIGAGQGAATGVAAGSYGGPWGMVIGGAIGLVAGGTMGYYQGSEKDKAVTKQKHAIAEQGRINETQARRQARRMTEEAMRNPTATSETLFRRTRLEREVTGLADIRDKGNPFHTEDKSKKRVPVAPQFYGKVA